jgi:branched-chain amino acid transport system permease protein
MEFLYRKTGIGLRLRAVSEDVDGASAIGVSKSRMSQMSALLAGLIALVTGFLLAPSQLVNPGLGISFTFNGFVAAALGGVGSLTGALVGGFAVGLLSQVASVYIGSLWVNTTLFAVLIGVYLLRPFGLFGQAPVRSV